MSVIEAPKRETPAESPVQAYQRGRSTRVWHWTVGTGLSLVVLATMHIVAQHFIVHLTGGLRTYEEVLSYVANPVIFVLESAFLVAVTIHAMLGVRGLLHDLDLSQTTGRRIDRWLWVVRTATVGYGMVLLITLALGA
jgi:succinate dehydrogenase hydrophobic anchor subunit